MSFVIINTDSNYNILFVNYLVNKKNILNFESIIFFSNYHTI